MFKRILDFKEAALARLRDKRKGVRYAVGPGFPLKGTVSLKGNAATSCNWSGQFANLSHTGASLLLPPAAITTRGEKTTLHLSIGQPPNQHTLEIPGVVAHFRVLATHSVCGLTLDFPDFAAHKRFAQLLEAVRIGASLKPTKATSSRRSAGPVVEQYQADSSTRLTVWRRGEDQRIERFEWVLGEHTVRGDGSGQLAIDAGESSKAPPGKAVTEEVERLYQWLLPNLGKHVPADVREFLRQATIPKTLAAPPPKPAQLSAKPGLFPPPRRPGTRPPQPAS